MRAFVLCCTFAASTLAAGPATRPVMPGGLERLLPEPGAPQQMPSYADATDRAEAEVHAGRYRRALITLSQAPAGERSALLKSRALGILGGSERAIAALTDLSTPAVKRQRATIEWSLGHHAAAVSLLRSADKSPLTLELLGRVLEDSGDIPAAADVFAALAEGADSPLAAWRTRGVAAFADATTLCAVASGVDRWATLRGVYRTSPRLNDEVLAMFTAAYDQLDTGYWPARVAAARYHVSHNDNEKAVELLKAAYDANPRDPAALSLLGQIVVDAYNFDSGDTLIKELRRINPRSIDADLLEARNFLRQRQAASAEPAIARVLAKRPKMPEAIGLLAAVRALQLRDDDAARLLAEVTAENPAEPRALFEVAEQLASLRQYRRAEAVYREAIGRAPWWAALRNGLGLLLTQSGDEDHARIVLREAIEVDPYNARTVNYLNLLGEMERFERIETPHFVVCFDRGSDPIIGGEIARRLEAVHDRIATLYAHAPAEKTLIEIFPTHSGFSVRTSGSPWIGTVGASTGRVIAMVSPRQEGRTLGVFNWHAVVQHEYVHTVTLSLTDNRVPHWMTEGLAVLDEGQPMRPEWAGMMYAAVTRGELFPLDQLTWGFVRPRRPIDRQLAYAQSSWVCEFIEGRWGRKKLLEMLGAFRDGKTEQQVFADVVGLERSGFTREFESWAQKKVGSWGYDEVTTKKFDILKKTGESQIKAKDFAQAVETWKAAAALRPVDVLPKQRLAGLYLSKQIDRSDLAIEQLKSLAGGEIKDNRYAMRAARLLHERGDEVGAAELASQASLIAPYESGPYELLAEIAAKKGDDAEALRLRDVVRTLAEWRAREASTKPASR